MAPVLPVPLPVPLPVQVAHPPHAAQGATHTPPFPHHVTYTQPQRVCVCDACARQRPTAARAPCWRHPRRPVCSSAVHARRAAGRERARRGAPAAPPHGGRRRVRRVPRVVGEGEGKRRSVAASGGGCGRGGANCAVEEGCTTPGGGRVGRGAAFFSVTNRPPVLAGGWHCSAVARAATALVGTDSLKMT